ncbi:DUF881 domain-containing protein [Saxibacter everestensis]|uniref:DUF881 domain-containing protein n=1 Tax=Saxibacter everestensis TaxID=2909229 RepID=A0ABY8QWG4_9MICO|nr:DUF881 domain-containing protein [Brevibacteriaceae bacterium ZFBP1038]
MSAKHADNPAQRDDDPAQHADNPAQRDDDPAQPERDFASAQDAAVERERPETEAAGSETLPSRGAGNDGPPRTRDGRSPWQRLRYAASMKTVRSQILAAILLAILGFGVVAQVKQTDESGLSSLSESDLVRVLDDVTERNDRLQAEMEELEQTRRELESGSNQQALAEEQAKERADTLAILAGTAPATGPGVILTITDPDAAVTAGDFVNLIQELRDAGAEAIQVNGSRVVANTAFLPAEDGGVAIGNANLTRPYTIAVIGDPDTISTALRIPGGVEDAVNQRGGSLAIKAQESVDVSAVIASG